MDLDICNLQPCPSSLDCLEFSGDTEGDGSGAAPPPGPSVPLPLLSSHPSNLSPPANRHPSLPALALKSCREFLRWNWAALGIEVAAITAQSCPTAGLAYHLQVIPLCWRRRRRRDRWQFGGAGPPAVQGPTGLTAWQRPGARAWAFRGVGGTYSSLKFWSPLISF